MKFSDETLMAFAGGELDQAMRRAIEAAMQDDPALAARIASYRAPRKSLSAACASARDESASPRPGATLHELNGHPNRRLPKQARNDGREGARMRAVAGVISLDSARAARGLGSASRHQAFRRWTWLEWGAIAAALLLGLVAGAFLMHILGR